MGRAKRPHVLLVTEKWCDCDPRVGDTNSKHVLGGSLSSSGLASYDLFHFDEYLYFKMGDPDQRLLAICAHTKPDLVFISWYAVPGSSNNPKLETVYAIRYKLDIPVIVCWWDAVFNQNMLMAEQLLPFIDFNVVFDSSEAYLNLASNKGKYVNLHVPNDPRIFYDPGLNRNIDVSFIGSKTGYPERLAALTFLQKEKVNLSVSGGQREEKLSPYQYASILQRSKITLNFSGSASGCHQLKGRVYEACLCGAMLMESKNPETAKKLRPLIDYVEFNDHRDLLQKVASYLADERNRTAIATSGRAKVSELYSGYSFWQRVLELI